MNYRPIFIFLFFIFPILGHGFSSVIGNIPPNGKDIHAQITHPVVDELGFSYIAYRHILTGNIAHDFYPGLVNTASFHCDRNMKVSNFDALKGCRQKFLLFKRIAIKSIKEGFVFRSLYMVGRSLHIAQDLIAHSNFVDLKPKDRISISTYFLGGAKGNLPDFKLTSWDHRVGKDQQSGLIKGDRYPHDLYAKDSPGMNPESNKKINGKTKFQLAFEEAQKISRLFLIDLRKELKPKQWEKLKLRKFQ